MLFKVERSYLKSLSFSFFLPSFNSLVFAEARSIDCTVIVAHGEKMSFFNKFFVLEMLDHFKLLSNELRFRRFIG